MSQVVEQVPLHLATAERYLSYALSVITSRALPDVRDGLKPVQRRILYTMYHDMGLVPNGRYRKCAGVVGEVMGKYHPHGDSSIYEALVRMAQDFSLRAPLVDGQGNFGSLDGDPPAAMRYTECRLRPLAEELLSEIKKRTVDFRPNYDGQRTEPVVLPAQLPHLLVNGSEGIAVGMATRIPPHNLGEVVDAAVALIRDRSRTVRDLVGIVRGPDFPTGGRILAGTDELVRIYEQGQGTLKVRATWHEEKEGRRRRLVVDSVPYGQNKAKIVEHLGEEVRLRRLPQVTDVRDESTDEVRVVLDLKADAAAETVMAYLFKRTALQSTWPVNLTALVPGADTDVPSPARLDLKAILEHWLDFRLLTVRRRYAFDLAQIRERIHVLEGFAKVFDALDEAIRLVREADGRAEAAAALIARFALSEIQADAVLDLRLYRLAKLEIEAILEELAAKRAEAERIEKLLASEPKLWAEVERELRALRKTYGEARRTEIGGGQQLEFDENAYIVAEDAWVVVTRDGWIKRQSSFSGLDKVRLRDGDEVGWLVQADTRTTLTFFTNLGSAYVMRVDAVPATTGYGEPVQASFTFADGEQVVGVLPHDPRHALPAGEPAAPDDPPPPYAVAITQGGRGLRFPLAPHAEVSNRTGRRYARLAEADQVFAVWPLPGPDRRVCLATRGGRAMVLAADDLPVLKAAGKGVTAIKVGPKDAVMACELGTDEGGGPVVVTSKGRNVVVGERTFARSTRGGKGNVVLKVGSIDQWLQSPVIYEVSETRPQGES
ncbi:MAG: DNA topoisomerase (ATP-hydrolyzing) [Myxococcota bacterium]